MDTVDKWYMKEVYFWRTVASVAWYVLCLPVAVLAYVVASHLDWRPLRWLSESTVVYLSLSTFGWILILSCINVLFACCTASKFRVMPEVHGRRLDVLLSLLRPSRLAHGVLCALLGALTALCCTNLLHGRYGSLTVVTEEAGSILVLNEFHLFLVLFGSFSGVHFYTIFYSSMMDYLEFPLLQQPKFFQVRGQMVPLCLHCCKLVARQLKNFYLLYFFCGKFVRNWIVDLLGLQLSPSVRRLDTVLGLMDLRLAWQAAVVGLLLTYSWNFFTLIIRAYQTEHFEFPLSVGLATKKSRQLQQALVCQNCPLVQYLGFLDLWHLSKFSETRRQQLFSLSQPGGHPHAWNSVSVACLQELEQFSTRVQEANWRAMANVPVKQSLVRDKPHDGTADRTSSTFVRSIGPNFTLRDQSSYTSKSQVSQEGVPPPSVKSKLMQRLAALSQKPIVSYFLMELPETKARRLFASAQLYNWTTEALSCLAAASYSEDRFGVVQSSLAPILTCLLNLLENVEKYMKLTGGGGMRRPVQPSPILPFDVPLRAKLHMVLKSAIYRITQRFGSHILDLNLSDEHVKRLRFFTEYMD